jgi:NADP-dependent 3-hydroxy acid dehydrogenase YdfG
LVQALAEAVLASGHKLVATANDPEPLRELVERYGDQLRIVPLEVTDASAVATAIEATLGAFGRLDVLVLDLAKLRSRLADQALQAMMAPPELTVPQRPNDGSAHASP